MSKKFYTYIILTENNKLYCGYTDNLKKRFKKHQDGKGAKFTRANKPLKLVYFKEFKTKSEAMKEEYRIKQLTRSQKEELISSFDQNKISLTKFSDHTNLFELFCNNIKTIIRKYVQKFFS